jgi:hypothetical protein
MCYCISNFWYSRPIATFFCFIFFTILASRTAVLEPVQQWTISRCRSFRERCRSFRERCRSFRERCCWENVYGCLLNPLLLDEKKSPTLLVTTQLLVSLHISGGAAKVKDQNVRRFYRGRAYQVPHREWREHTCSRSEFLVPALFWISG